jgi:hypothetical protein
MNEFFLFLDDKIRKERMTTVQGIDKIHDSLGYLVLNDDGAVLGVRTNLICINQTPIYCEHNMMITRSFSSTGFTALQTMYEIEG